MIPDKLGRNVEMMITVNAGGRRNKIAAGKGMEKRAITGL
jgi:hypothetical protein